MQESGSEPAVHVSRCAAPLTPEVSEKLRDALSVCPDVAFCYLGDVLVEGHEAASPTLFVWLEGRAVGSVRSALALVSRAVSGSLPADRFLDVVILNSAPELLSEVAARAELLVERNEAEHRRAMDASHQPFGQEAQEASSPSDERPWWIRLFGG
jgi:hypothetical protein